MSTRDPKSSSSSSYSGEGAVGRPQEPPDKWQSLPQLKARLCEAVDEYLEALKNAPRATWVNDSRMAGARIITLACNWRVALGRVPPAPAPHPGEALTSDQVQLLAWAVSNCHTLARRALAYSVSVYDREKWEHVLRICEKAGARSTGVLRASLPTEITEGSEGVVSAPAPHPQEDAVVKYRVEPDDDGDWHVLTFSNGVERKIFTRSPLVIVQPEAH